MFCHAERALGLIPSGHCPSDLVSLTTTSIIFNEEMYDIIKIVKSVKESCLFIKGVSKTIKNEAK